MVTMTEKYTLYVATNTVTGQQYIGVTAAGIARRRGEHHHHATGKNGKSPFHVAIREYGIEAFEFSVLSEVYSLEMAIREEISAIKTHNPEYNVRRGGGGVGSKMSEASRLKIGLEKLGNTYSANKKRTEQFRERTRAIGLQNKDEWAKRSYLGPEAVSRSVVCLDENIVFLSASAAARHYGVAKSALIELCLGQRGRKTVGGHRFAYVEAIDATG